MWIVKSWRNRTPNCWLKMNRKKELKKNLEPRNLESVSTMFSKNSASSGLIKWRFTSWSQFHYNSLFKCLQKAWLIISHFLSSGLAFLAQSYPVASNHILSVAIFGKKWKKYSELINGNPFLNNRLSAHLNLLLPHVAKGNKFGQHWSNLS